MKLSLEEYLLKFHQTDGDFSKFQLQQQSGQSNKLVTMVERRLQFAMEMLLARLALEPSVESPIQAEAPAFEGVCRVYYSRIENRRIPR